MAELAAYERDVCRDCGWHTSLTGDTRNVFTYDHHVCPVCAGADRMDRIDRDRHQTRRHQLWGEDPPANRRDPADGIKTHSRLMTAGEADQWRAKQTDKPTGPPGRRRKDGETSHG